MKTEPRLNKVKLKHFISKNWGLEVKKLKFVPKGEASWGYIIVTNSQKFFIKIFGNKRQHQLSISRLDRTLMITHQLYSKCGITNIAHPIPTADGELKSVFSRHTVLLYNYFEGINEDDLVLTKKQRISLGTLLGQVHSATKRLNIAGSKIFKCEEFENVNNMEKILKDLKNPKKIKNRYHKELVKLILPHESVFLKLKEKVILLHNKLKKKVIRGKLQQVICHKDAISLNFIVGKDDEIYLLDWDAVGFALKEVDLWIHLWENSRWFLESYEKQLGKFKINKDATNYYFLARLLEDVFDFGRVILYEDKNKEDYKFHLSILKDWAVRYSLNYDCESKKLNKIIDGWNKK